MEIHAINPIAGNQSNEYHRKIVTNSLITDGNYLIHIVHQYILAFHYIDSGLWQKPWLLLATNGTSRYTRVILITHIFFPLLTPVSNYPSTSHSTPYLVPFRESLRKFLSVNWTFIHQLKKYRTEISPG